MISLNRHSIDVKVHDRYATIDYLFKFKNNSPLTGSNELKFEITIDPDAFISHFKANIDGEIFIGKTKQKEAAPNEHLNIKTNGQNTILIQQTNPQIPNLFTISTNMNHGSAIILTITIEQYLTKKFSFNALDIQILKFFDKYSIQNCEFIALTFNINDNSGIYDVMINNIPLKSEHRSGFIIDNHSMDKAEQKCIINGKIMVKAIINEITLQYKIQGEQNESMVLYDNKSKTFCHVISDIFNNDKQIKYTEQKDDMFLPRRVVFVIDKSNSMRGYKWTKTINAIITALKQLRYGYDRYCIILFADSVDMLSDDKLILCDETNINETVSFLQKYVPGGGTNINDALLKGVSMIEKDALLCKDNGYIYMNQMFLIINGQSSVGERDTKKIVQNIRDINYSEKISIFSFGVGSVYNHSFLKTLAVNNYGFYKRVKALRINDVLVEYFKMLSKPMLCDINVTYNSKNVCDLTKHKFNGLYCGNDLIICGKMNTKHEQKEFELNAIINAVTAKAGKPIHVSKKITTNVVVDNSYDNVEKIWAYLKLQQLTIKKLILNDMIDSEDNEKKEQTTALQLAMKYKFITPWTSMIVVKANGYTQVDKMQKSTTHHMHAHGDVLCNDIFIAKTKEIERRIIQHLHERGYTESHPDYHRYIAKAKQLAIEKTAAIRKKRAQLLRQENESMKKVRMMNNNVKLKSKSGGMDKYLIILRGLPGSGKTTLAKKIAAKNGNNIICSEDKYHWSSQEEGIGIYKFEASLVFDAREWCNKEIMQSINNGIELIIIDNHNSKIKMYQQHLKFAIQNGYRFKIMEFISNESLIDKYRTRSYKPFPKDIYIKLLELWEKDTRAQLINPVFDEIKPKVEPKKPMINTVWNTFPMKYEIHIQAKVRSEKDLNSAHVTDLPEGTIITVKQIIGNRARISFPVYGWLSVKSKYNEYIIVPTHKDYEKIGGKIMFKKRVEINGKYIGEGKIINYDEIRKLYKIRYNDRSTQWIDLKDKNIIFIKERHHASNMMLSGNAQPFSLQKTETFFNEFFCRDYPQYQALSSSTKEKMEIGDNNIKTISNYSRIW